MSKCDLSIEFDNTPIHGGDMLRGQVVVSVDSDCKCKELSVNLHRYTHGKGNTQSKKSTPKVIFTGEWRAGETHRYPFKIQLPRTPITYHGHFLNVDWAVEAAADIPWSFDPKTKQDFVVLPPKESGLQLTSDDHRSTGAKRTNKLVLGGIAAMFIVIPMLLMILMAIQGHLLLLLFPSLFVLVGIGIIYVMAKKRIAGIKLGTVTTHIDTFTAEGGALSCELSFDNRSARVSNVTATLILRETVTRGSGTSRSTYRHDVLSETVPMQEGTSQSNGICYRAQLPIPDTMHLPTFDITDNSLTWAVKFHVDIPDWPDWEYDHSMLGRLIER